MVRQALKRPVTIIVLFLGMLLFSGVAIRTIPIDIFPKLNAPTIYVIMQYGGMSAGQMEGFFSTRAQDQFLYVNGVKNIESKNIQGLTLLKLTFYEGTDMAEATAQVALQSNRMLAFFPPGSLPPQVVRFDASSLPVGELVFSTNTRSLQEVFDLALTRIRPLFATVPGLSAAPAFGSNARTVVVHADPQKLSAYRMSADELVEAIARNNAISPSGNLRVDSTMYITTVNTLEEKVADFEKIPLRSDGTSVVTLGDVARVSDAADITVDYALVDGKRSVYIPVVKTADASTWDVVKGVREKLPEMQALLPDDVQVHYAFDQSVFVINALKSLMTEGILGAVLTGLVVLLFLRDWRSSMVVIITIPISVLSAVFFLKLAGQTINIMTLSGLALSIGILVDQATVTIENIHQHLEMGKDKRRAILDACTEISFPLLLILLCILAVFAPAFIMTGVPKAMFLPLSLSIGFAMIVSFVAAQTLVPVLSNWLLHAKDFRYRHDAEHAHAGLALDHEEVEQVGKHAKEDAAHPEENKFFQRLKQRLVGRLDAWMPKRHPIVIAYLVVMIGLTALGAWWIGKDMLPRTNNGQLQVRLREPDGTRLEVTEVATKRWLALVDSATDHRIDITSAYVGLVPSNFGTSNLYIFNSGTHEAVIQVNLDESWSGRIEDLKEKLRAITARVLPGVRISFEPIELTEKIMSQGSPTPIEVRVSGKNMDDITRITGQLQRRMNSLPFLRDVDVAQPLHYPTIRIDLDRQRLAQMGFTPDLVSRSITAATSSSRYLSKNFWLDDRSHYTYQTQVQVPEYVMSSVEELKAVPLVKGADRPLLGDVATISVDSLPGEYDRSGPRRYVTLNANLHGVDLDRATTSIEHIVAGLGKLPAGLVVEVRGMSSLLRDTLSSLQSGLLAAIVVILLMLTASYQSFRLALTVLSTVPAVLFGSIALLLLTGSTLNLQSYMGMIMSVGVSVANALLVVTNAEGLRREYRDPFKAASVAAGIRLRPILMTSIAMVVGMLPMAIGAGEAGDQSAPLGRAVIGGLIASTASALLVLPLVFGWVQSRASFDDGSLLPDDQTEKK